VLVLITKFFLQPSFGFLEIHSFRFTFYVEGF
jgi:hypothetical protein